MLQASSSVRVLPSSRAVQVHRLAPQRVRATLRVASDWEAAKTQARADVACHEEKECGQGEKTIAIYFSPNQGGNKHADLSYAEKIREDELTLEKDNQGQAYQETQINNDKPTDWTPWIIGGSIFLVGGLILFRLISRKKKIKKANK